MQNVFQFPDREERVIERAKRAMRDYEAGILAEAAGRRSAIHAVIEMGEALAEGRELHPGAKEFGRWVVASGLDQGKPWDNNRERSEAIKIASLFRNGAEDAFDGCPNAIPSGIMKWWRRTHPDPDKKPRKPRVAKPKAPKPAPEEKKAAEDQAIAEMTPKSKMTIKRAIQVHKKRLEKRFNDLVAEEVRKQIAKADQAVREQNAELRREVDSLRQALQAKGIFSKAEYRQLQMAVHPDSSASIETRNGLLAMLVEREKRLVTG